MILKILKRFVTDLMRHITMYFVEISRKNDLKNIAEQPNIILSVGFVTFGFNAHLYSFTISPQICVLNDNIL